MSGNSGPCKVLSPVGKTNAKKVQLSPHLSDLSGKTICALRHTFRADETFQIIEELFHRNYPDIKFISNHEMPDLNPTTAEQEAHLIRAFRERGCEVVLAGNGA